MTEKQKRTVGRPRNPKAEYTTMRIRPGTLDLVNAERLGGESHDDCIRRVFGEKE